MQVTLIFSRHTELGRCTSDALLQIIEAVNPDVIFEELSEAFYEEAYVANTLKNLEPLAIKKFLAIRDVPHIPVDTFERPVHYDSDQKRLWEKLKDGVNLHSFQLRGLCIQLEERIEKGGFDFLNGSKNEIAFENIEILKERALETLNDENLHCLALLDKEVIENREDVMLDNVYAYCKENPVQNGLMFIGSGHMKSIKHKIAARQKTEDGKINWRYFSDVNIVSM